MLSALCAAIPGVHGKREGGLNCSSQTNCSSPISLALLRSSLLPSSLSAKKTNIISHRLITHTQPLMEQLPCILSGGRSSEYSADIAVYSTRIFFQTSALGARHLCYREVSPEKLVLDRIVGHRYPGSLSSQTYIHAICAAGKTRGKRNTEVEWESA